MRPLSCHHNGFMATHALGYMMYGYTLNIYIYIYTLNISTKNNIFNIYK